MHDSRQRLAKLDSRRRVISQSTSRWSQQCGYFSFENKLPPQLRRERWAEGQQRWLSTQATLRFGDSTGFRTTQQQLRCLSSSNEGSRAIFHPWGAARGM